MRATIVTTIAQHPKGLDLHLRNLQWALKGLDYEIVINTFQEHNILVPGCRIIEVDADASQFYYFYDELDFTKFDSDVVLAIEQDIFFTEPIAWQAEICMQNCVVTNMESDFYLCLVNKQQEVVYPRIWEGGTWIPRQLIEMSAGCSYGFSPKLIIPGNPMYENNINILESTYASCRSIQYARPLTEVLARNRVDNLFELTVFGFLHSYPQRCFGENDYEYGKHLVHIRGIESLCRDKPNIYNDFDEIKTLMDKVAYRRWCNNCALMLLLCGIHDIEAISRWLRYRPNIENINTKIERMLIHGHEWLTNDELKRLKLAQNALTISLI